MMRLVVPVAAVLALAAPAFAQKPAIDAALVTKIEQQMVMPTRAQPLKSYSRFYALAQAGGRTVVRGVYLGWSEDFYLKTSTPVAGVAGAYVMSPGSDLPLVVDGGCSVVETAFDLATQKLVDNPMGGVADSENSKATARCHGR